MYDEIRRHSEDLTHRYYTYEAMFEQSSPSSPNSKIDKQEEGNEAPDRPQRFSKAAQIVYDISDEEMNTKFQR